MYSKQQQRVRPRNNLVRELRSGPTYGYVRYVCYRMSVVMMGDGAYNNRISSPPHAHPEHRQPAR